MDKCGLEFGGTVGAVIEGVNEFRETALRIGNQPSPISSIDFRILRDIEKRCSKSAIGDG
jgi:hypothetical protein